MRLLEAEKVWYIALARTYITRLTDNQEITVQGKLIKAGFDHIEKTWCGNVFHLV